MSLDDFVGFIVSILLFLLIGGHNLFSFQRRKADGLQSIIAEDEEEAEEAPFVEEVEPIKAAPLKRVPIPPVVPQVIIKKAEREIPLGKKVIQETGSLKKAFILKTILDRPVSDKD